MTILSMMSLEHATGRVAAAVAAQDIEGINVALEARAAAIMELAGTAPSAELADEMVARLTAALQAGEAIHRDLSAMKLRIGFESARLAQFETGFVAGVRRRPSPRIDYRG